MSYATASAPWWSSAIGPIVAAVVAALIAFVGVAVAQQNARRIAYEAHLEARRDQRRELIVDVVAAGGEYIDLLMVIAPGIAMMDTGELQDITETDTGKRLSDLRARVTRLLVVAKLSIPRGEVVAQQIMIVRSYVGDITTKVMGPLIQDHESRDARVEAIGNALVHLRQTRQAIDNLEEFSTQQLAIEVDPLPRLTLTDRFEDLKAGWRAARGERARRRRETQPKRS